MILRSVCSAELAEGVSMDIDLSSLVVKVALEVSWGVGAGRFGR